MKTLRHIAVRTVQSAVLGAASMGLLLAPSSGFASGAEAKLSVTATLMKRASLQVIEQPTAVVITAADIAKGYVDLPTATQVAIKSNSSRGYMLEFGSQGDFLRQIMVTGLANEVQMSPAGGFIVQPPTSTGVTRVTLNLGFRFVLAESVQAGTYAWPMRFSVIAL